MSKYIRILTTPCADASYTLVDENSNSLGTGTIPSGINDNITAPNASVDVEKTDGTLIENESILSGGSSTITIPDTVVTIAGGTINVMATDPLTIPIKDMDGNVVGSTLVGGEVIISDLPCAPSADGTIEIYDTDGALIFTGPVTPETTLTHTIADSTAVLRDTGGNIISTTSIVAEGSEDIIAPDVTYTILDTASNVLYNGNIISGGLLNQIINDTEVNIRKTDNSLISSQMVLAEGLLDYTVANSTINVDGHSWAVMATDILNLSIVDSSGGNIVPTTKIGNEVIIDSGYCLDATVNIVDSNSTPIGSVVVPSGGVGSFEVPNENITVNGNLLINKPSVEDYDVEVVDSENNAVSTSISGGKVVIDDLPCSKELDILVPYSSGDGTATFTIVADSDGTITTEDTIGLTNVTYEVNSAPTTLPFTLAVGDVLTINFDTASADGVIKLEGTYA